MIMPKGQQLLLPVNPVFIVASLVLALALNLLPLGRVVWTPDWVMVLLVFWGIHQPQRVGLGVAFAMGLCIDVAQSALLGQHALVYCGVMFGAQLAHRRGSGRCGRRCSCCRCSLLAMPWSWRCAWSPAAAPCPGWRAWQRRCWRP